MVADPQDWLFRQLEPLLLDAISEIRIQGVRDMYLDKIDTAMVMLRTKSKYFRSLILHFMMSSVTTSPIARMETGIQRKQIIQWFDKLVQCGICGCYKLSDHLPDAPGNIGKIQIYYLEASLIPLFLEKHYRKYLSTTTNVKVLNGRTWSCPECGVYYEFPTVKCLDCKFKLPSRFIPKKIRAEIL